MRARTCSSTRCSVSWSRSWRSRPLKRRVAASRRSSRASPTSSRRRLRLRNDAFGCEAGGQLPASACLQVTRIFGEEHAMQSPKAVESLLQMANRRFHLAVDGQDVLEYGLHAALIALVAIGAVSTVGQTIYTVFWQTIGTNF